ncbi:helix-turn-helix transcriptional regulator [Streptomyces sp. NPDC003077]|uniref:helix-turn-helix transcriptional regulator n=1 Tax=Streptomyces sp. NPDC003077 TaxID=3154443 RepID=UPI0033AD6AFE
MTVPSTMTPGATRPRTPAATARPTAPPAAPTRPEHGSARGEAELRRAELAAFLRSRRERTMPEQVGLPRGRRRRTPGLRREEVAQLATVGVTWYTWLEQGRDIHVSPQVLSSIARALMLDRAERNHLFALAGAADPEPDRSCTGLPEGTLQLLDQLGPYPAVIQNTRFDLLAYNRSYGRLLCDLDAVPPEERNCLWLAFTHPDWRAAITDWDETVRLLVARFRASTAGNVSEPAAKALVARLAEVSEDFRRIWARHEVVQPTSKCKLFHQADVGLLRVATTSLWTGPQFGPRMIAYTPMDEETRVRLDRLHALAMGEGQSAGG